MIIYHYNRLNPSSIVANIPNDIEIQRQGLRSIQVVYDFFQDKESHYLELVKRFYILYLYRMLNTNHQYRNRESYDEFLSQLQQVDSNAWDLIGWDKPCKKAIDQNYQLKKLSFFIVEAASGLYNVIKHYKHPNKKAKLLCIS